MVHLRVLKLTRSTGTPAGAAGALRNPVGCDDVLFWNWYLLRVKYLLSDVHNTAFWYLLGVLFKVSENLCE